MDVHEWTTMWKQPHSSDADSGSAPIGATSEEPSPMEIEDARELLEHHEECVSCRRIKNPRDSRRVCQWCGGWACSAECALEHQGGRPNTDLHQSHRKSLAEWRTHARKSISMRKSIAHVLQRLQLGLVKVHFMLWTDNVRCATKSIVLLFCEIQRLFCVRCIVCLGTASRSM